ncbi:MAG: hypothetical protein JJ971_09625 [Balneolaceae bacterium]|nr:hypothetical protein [Balneolaceae bacterium]MBO6546495.1 hypothetical protein [Balneolaceae bacterium]MBO6648854.1 hypothetical protein [Balneolaceae bacterium]
MNADLDLSKALWTGFIGGVIGLVLYGSIFFLTLIISITALDLMLIGKEEKKPEN